MAHARLSASAAHRWMICAGSVRQCEGLPNKSGPDAAAGTLAHEIAANCLTKGHLPHKYLNKEGERDGHKVVCDQEMVDGVKFYLDTLHAAKEPGDVDWVEVDLTTALRTIDPDCGGTADHVRFRPAKRHLFVSDFKYGAGVVVEPEGNKQLLLYALGALLDADKRGAIVDTVTVRIIQPRIEHEDGRVREWTFSAIELLDFAADVAESASRTRDANAPLVPGDVQCKWCLAARTCPELEKRQHALVAAEFTEIVPYDPVALAKALDAIPLVEARIKAIREFAYAEAERGNPPPGYKLVAKRAVRRFVDEEEFVEHAKREGVDAGILYEAPSLKSPAQVEKILGKKAFAAFAGHVASISSGHTLAREDDKRPAVHKALAEEFAVIPGEK